MNTQFSTYASYWMAEHQAGARQHRQDDPHSAYMVELLAKWRRDQQAHRRTRGAARTKSPVHIFRKVGIIKKAIRVYNAARRPTRAADWSIDGMLRTKPKTPDNEMVETDDLKRRAAAGQDGQTRGRSFACALASTTRSRRP